MMSTENGRSRYPDARVKGVLEFFELVREEATWRPDPITKQTLSTLGMAKGKETNQLFALEFLGIIDSEGRPTEEFDSLRNDFQGTLKGLVLASYSQLFETVPTSRMNQETVVAYFMTEGYSEESAEYQGKLFAELCSLAGIDLPNMEEKFERARFRNEEE